MRPKLIELIAVFLAILCLGLLFGNGLCADPATSNVGTVRSANEPSTDTSGQTITISTTDLINSEFSFDEFVVGGSFAYIPGLRGKPTKQFLFTIPIMNYSKKTAENAYQKMFSLNYDSDVPIFGEQHYLSISAPLKPINDALKKGIGQNGLIEIPVVDKLVTRYVNLEGSIGVGYDFGQDRVAFPIKLLILQGKF